jgi:hypothetical protein
MMGACADQILDKWNMLCKVRLGYMNMGWKVHVGFTPPLRMSGRGSVFAVVHCGFKPHYLGGPLRAG